jgi:hypothetical protein
MLTSVELLHKISSEYRLISRRPADKLQQEWRNPTEQMGMKQSSTQRESC